MVVILSYCLFLHFIWLLSGANVGTDVDHAVQCIKKMISLAEDLVPKTVDFKEKEIGDQVDKEMASTTSAIEEAARRIAVSW